MPCWQVQILSCKFNAKHKALLVRAVLALGWKVETQTINKLTVTMPGSMRAMVIDLDSGVANIPADLQEKLNLLKQEYAYQAIEHAARNAGWKWLKRPNRTGELVRGADRIKVDILADGMVSVTTDAISRQNHVSADNLLKDLATMLGGVSKTTKRNKLAIAVQQQQHHHHH